jgi:hypothetical protein
MNIRPWWRSVLSTPRHIATILYPGPMRQADGHETFDRRHVLKSTAVGAALLVAAGTGATALLGGCSRRRATDVTEAPVNFLGANRQPGDPLYSTAASAYVAVVPADVFAEAKQRWGPDLDPAVADGIIALSEDCPHDSIPLQYCSIENFRGYVCPACKSLFTYLGDRATGVTTRGMDRRKVSIDESGELIINPIGKVDGPKGSIPRVNTWLDVNGCLANSVLPPNQRRRPTA